MVEHKRTPGNIPDNGQDKPVRIIPKEEAVFWMDAQGCWHNAHGLLEHPKIIAHFNRSIHKDDQGYFLSQEMETYIEKVYFPYVDTAFFVVGLKGDDGSDLALNTGETLPLDPQALFVKADDLFMTSSLGPVKFSPKALVKISKYFSEPAGQLVLTFDGKTYPISEEQI